MPARQANPLPVLATLIYLACPALYGWMFALACWQQNLPDHAAAFACVCLLFLFFWLRLLFTRHLSDHLLVTLTVWLAIRVYIDGAFLLGAYGHGLMRFWRIAHTLLLAVLLSFLYWDRARPSPTAEAADSPARQHTALTIQSCCGWVLAIPLLVTFGWCTAAVPVFWFGWSMLVLQALGFTLAMIYLVAAAFLNKYLRGNGMQRRFAAIALLAGYVLLLYAFVRDPAQHNIPLTWERLIAPGQKSRMKSYKPLVEGSELVCASEQWPALPQEAAHYPLMHADLIRRTWTNAASAIRALMDLRNVPGIIDLTNDPRTPRLSSALLERLTHLHAAYALLLAEEGDPLAGARVLVGLQQVVRKALPYAVNTHHKGLWLYMNMTLSRSAHALLISPHADAATASELEKPFSPLTEQEIALEKALQGHALMSAAVYRLDIMGIVSGEQDPLSPDFRLKRPVEALFASLVKVRTYSREVHRFCDLILRGSRAKPPSLDLFLSHYQRYLAAPVPANLQVWSTLQKAFHVPVKLIDITTHAKVLSDLFALEIAEKTNHQLILKDYINGGSYEVQPAIRAYRSTGRDGISGTADDIAL